MTSATRVVCAEARSSVKFRIIGSYPEPCLDIYFYNAFVRETVIMQSLRNEKKKNSNVNIAVKCKNPVSLLKHHHNRWWALSHPAPVLPLFTLLRACIQALPTMANAKAAESGYKHGWLDPAHVPYAKNMCRLILTRPSEGAGHVICPAGNVGHFSISA